MTTAGRKSIVIVTGLSGAGKASILNALEDVGYETVDNPPLPMLEKMVADGDRKLAVGVDARTRGFDAKAVLDVIERLRRDPDLRVQLVYARADEATLLRRYTESRRRHPLAPQGRVADGIIAEQALTELLKNGADLVVDTSDLPIAHLRRLIERHFGAGSEDEQVRMIVSLISFAYPKGLPREADLVFDARFLRNPHYDPILRAGTGLDGDVAAYVEADPDFAKYFAGLIHLIDLILPRFVQEGKKYATITIGCTGGRHRSVHLIEKLAQHLTGDVSTIPGGTGERLRWRVHVTHRELSREGMQAGFVAERPVAPQPDSDLDKNARTLTVQSQEA
jgi:UPF0042 nucleotide-binding protein